MRRSMTSPARFAARAASDSLIGTRSWEPRNGNAEEPPPGTPASRAAHQERRREACGEQAELDAAGRIRDRDPPRSGGIRDADADRPVPQEGRMVSGKTKEERARHGNE